MVAPPEVLQAAANWEALTRWERAELGRSLRRQGWAYSEIMEVLPVGKGTLSGWCREIRMTDEQIQAIKARVPSQKGVPKDTNWRRRLQIEKIREAARDSFRYLQFDPDWIAGVTMYWAEGAKTYPSLNMVNTDARVLRLFISWVRQFIDPAAEFGLALHLHEGNVEDDAKAWWTNELDLPGANYTKTFIKPAGTGHRKNRWLHGVCRVKVKRSADAYYTTMAWITCLAETWDHRAVKSSWVASSTAEQGALNAKVASSNLARPTT